MVGVLPLCLFTFLPLKAQLIVTDNRASAESQLRKLSIAEMAIKNLYVEEVDEQKLVEDAIRGMLEKLDPHSTYTNPKETKAVTEPLNGSFEGIGVQFNMVEDTLIVIQPVINGPSEKVGIVAGDRIVMVNDTAIAGVKMSKEEIMRRLRGPKGTIADLRVVRPGIKDLLTFKVKRDKIPVHTIDASYMLKPGVGYIRIGSFGATTYDEFMERMAQLKAEGMKDLVLDLQENGGGYLQAAFRRMVAAICRRLPTWLASSSSLVTSSSIPRADRCLVATIKPIATARSVRGALWCWSTSSPPLPPRLSLVPSRIRTVVSSWVVAPMARVWYSVPSSCSTAL